MESETQGVKLPVQAVVVCPFAQHTGFPEMERPREDSVDLIYFLGVLLKRWVALAMAMILFGIAGGLYSLTLPNVFKASALVVSTKKYKTSGSSEGMLGKLAGLAAIAGVQGAGDQDSEGEMAKAWLNTRPFAEFAVKRFDLASKFGAEFGGRPISAEEAAGILRSGTKLEKDDTLSRGLRISFLSESPQLAVQMPGIIVKAINIYMQELAIDEAREEIAIISSQVDRTQQLNAQGVLYGIISEKTKEIALAESRVNYSFQVLEYPIDSIKVKPSRAMIISSFSFGGLILAILAVFITELITKKRDIISTLRAKV